MAKRNVMAAAMVVALGVGGLAAPALAEEGHPSSSAPSTRSDRSTPTTPVSRPSRPGSSSQPSGVTKPTRAEGETLDALRTKCAAFLEQQGGLANALLGRVAASTLTDAQKAELVAKITAAAQKVADAKAALAAATDRTGIVGACEAVRAVLARITVSEHRDGGDAHDHGAANALEGVAGSLDRLTKLADKLAGVSAALADKGADTAAANGAIDAMRADLATASAALDAAKVALGSDPTDKHAVRDALKPVRAALDAARRDAKTAVGALRAAAHKLRDTTSSSSEPTTATTAAPPVTDVTNGPAAGAHD